MVNIPDCNVAIEESKHKCPECSVGVKIRNMIIMSGYVGPLDKKADASVYIDSLRLKLSGEIIWSICRKKS